MRGPSGEFDTFQITGHWIATTAEGRKALVVETAQGRTIAFELPKEILATLATDLATLAGLMPPSNKPNA